MTDPFDTKKLSAVNRLKSLRFVTAGSLFVETAFTTLWRPVCWSALFIGMWMWNVPAALGHVAGIIMLATYIIGLIYFMRPVFKTLRMPAHRDVNRRLERANNLQHRPIEAIEDTLINPEKRETRSLWEHNKARAIEAVSSLRPAFPNIQLSNRDPYALRYLAIIILVTGFVAAGPDWKGRIYAGFQPFPQNDKAEKSSKYTIWITPPDYTNLAQIVLQENMGDNVLIDIPEGSSIKIRLTGGWTTPQYSIGENETSLTPLDGNHWSLEAPVTEGNNFKLRQLPFTNLSFDYNYIEDTPPNVTLLDTPETLEKGSLRTKLSVLDDYGVTNMTMRMTLAPNVDASPLGAPYEESRALISPANEELEVSPVYDLAWHPWAGLPVVLEFTISDFKGQSTTLAPLTLTLPERQFSNPIARELVDMRKRLIWTPREAARNVSYELSDFLMNPSQLRYDPTIFLAIRSAASRLHYDPELKDIISVIELLWDTAIRLEDGNLPLAARNLREARENLEALLNDPNATDEQIAKATQELQEALAQYFQELMQEMQRRMAENGTLMQIPPDAMQSLVSPEDIASFLDQLKAEALSGDKSKALDLLSQLQQFMDKLDPSVNMAMPPQMEFMMEGINELQELIEKQKALLEETNEIVQEHEQFMPKGYGEFLQFEEQILKNWGFGEIPPPPSRNNENDSAPEFDTADKQIEQDALRYILGQLMLDADEQLNEIPEKMQLAEQEMRGSGSALGKNDPQQSIPHQELALQYLQEAMQDMSQQMQQIMKQMAMMALGSMRLDPLGRPMQEGNNNSGFPGSTVKIPDEGERKRAEEILQELRKRSGEYSRPDYELEYYRRLLKQF